MLVRGADSFQINLRGVDDVTIIIITIIEHQMTLEKLCRLWIVARDLEVYLTLLDLKSATQVNIVRSEDFKEKSIS